MIERKEAMRVAPLIAQAERLVKELKRLLDEIKDPPLTKRLITQIEQKGSDARCSEEEA